MQNQNQTRLYHTRFPAPGADSLYPLGILISSLCYLCLLWSSILIGLVLNLRHSNKNRPKNSDAQQLKYPNY